MMSNTSSPVLLESPSPSPSQPPPWVFLCAQPMNIPVGAIPSNLYIPFMTTGSDDNLHLPDQESHYVSYVEGPLHFITVPAHREFSPVQQFRLFKTEPFPSLSCTHRLFPEMFPY